MLINFTGYLMTEKGNSKHPGTFECVDSEPLTTALSVENSINHGATFSFVRPSCDDGAHCPPNDPLKELLCVVCTK